MISNLSVFCMVVNQIEYQASHSESPTDKVFNDTDDDDNDAKLVLQYFSAKSNVCAERLTNFLSAN